MIPRIETYNEKKFAGKKVMMTFREDKTWELWQGFMPKRRKIKNTVGTELYSLQIYGEEFDFASPNIDKEFVKYAMVEVTDFKDIPVEMEKLTIEKGLYAVFMHKGAQITAMKTYKYIFLEWLSNSEYEVDSRPHVEILGEKYKNNDMESEEEIWIPVRKRKVEDR